MKKAIALTIIISVQLGWTLAERGQSSSLERFLFPPELVMKNQEKLQLTEEQRETIVREIQQAQSELTSLHWDVRRETEDLTSLLKNIDLDEEAILTRFDAVLDLERRIKRTQLILAVRMRNVLNDEQLIQLRKLRIRSNLQRRRGERRPLRNP
jgi:hypothetical protein